MVASFATPQEFDKQTIIQRLMIPMIIESIRCFEDGIVNSPAELDMGLIYGIGFPPYLGGALRHASEVGLANFCAMADQYKDLGPAYEVTDKMREMAANNQGYYPA